MCLLDFASSLLVCLGERSITYFCSQILFEAGFLRIPLIPPSSSLLPQHIKGNGVQEGGGGGGGRVARLAGKCQMALETQRDDFSVSIQQLSGLWPS